MRFPILVVLLLLCGCAVPVQSASRARDTRLPPPESSVHPPPEAGDLLRRINRHRRALGCPDLAWDARLAAVAQRHSRDMARRGFFDHENLEGVDPFRRIERAGIRFRAAAENLAMGTRDEEEVFDGWMKSRGHRRNLEECVYDRAGIGLSGDYWTLVLAKLRPESRP